MAVHLRTLRGDPIDIGDDDAEGEKYKYSQPKIKRMVERHDCAPLIDAGFGENLNVSAAPGLDPDQGPVRAQVDG
jgi:hypothetical protein